MSTLTVFGNYSKRQHQMARLEDYTRAITHLEKSIERVKENYQNGLDFIAKLKADQQTTEDKKQLKQIEVDLAYLQEHFEPTAMTTKINNLEAKLRHHYARLKKLQEKYAAPKTSARETA